MAKNLFFTVATASLLMTASSQAAFMSIDEVVDIYLLGKLKGEYQSNIFSTENNEVDDTIITVSPGVEINVGRQSRARLNLKFYEHIVRFSDTTALNKELADLTVTGFYDMQPMVLSSGFSFKQNQTNTPGTLANPATGANLVERDLYSLFGSTEYSFTEKVYGTGGLYWSFTDYTNNDEFGGNFSDNYSFSLPLDLLYRITPKYSIGVGYRFRFTEVDDNPVRPSNTFYDNFISLAVRGEVLPKVRLNSNAGVQFRSPDVGSDQVFFTVLSELAWDATPKMTVTGGYSQDFTASSTGNSSVRYNFYTDARYAWTPKISSNAGLRYTISDYRDVDQGNNTLGFNIGTKYSPNDYLSFGAGYRFTTNDTHNSARGRDYDRHSLNATINVRY